MKKKRQPSVVFTVVLILICFFSVSLGKITIIIIIIKTTDFRSSFTEYFLLIVILLLLILSYISLRCSQLLTSSCLWYVQSIWP